MVHEDPPTWLDVLLAPHEVAPHPNASHATELGPTQVAALLLEQRRLELSRLGEPEYLRADRWPEDIEQRFVAALHRYLEGEIDRAIDGWLGVAAGSRGVPDLGAAATVLASVAETEMGNQDSGQAMIRSMAESVAADRLERDSPISQVDLALAVLDQHLGLHHAHRLEWADAVTATQRVLEASERRTGRVARILAVVAAYNRWNFEIRLGGPSTTTETIEALTSRPLPAALQGRPLALAAGLGGLLEEGLRETFTRTGSHGLRVQAEDRVERSLRAAVLHDRCLADYAGVRRTVTQLGRSMIARARTGGGDPGSESFSCLARGDDHDLLQQAAGWYWRNGPLAGLAEAVGDLASLPWLPSAERTTLRLLEVVGDLVPPELSDEVATHLLDLARGDGPVLPRTYDVVHYSLGALSALLPAASDDTHVLAAEHVLHAARTVPHGVRAHALADIVTAVRWDEAEQQMRDRLLEMARAVAGTDEDVEVLSRAAVVAATEWDEASALDIALSAYRSRPSLRWGLLLSSPRVDVPDDVLAAVADEAAEQVRASIASARKRSWSIGGGDPAVVLVRALLKRPPESGASHWDAIIDYLAEPRTGADSTRAVVAQLGGSAESVPESLRDRLSALSAEGLRGTVLSGFEGDAIELPGATLDLQLALGTASAVDVLAGLVTLAGSRAIDQRVEAARLLEPALGQAAHASGLDTLTGVLVGDPVADVRAWAARAVVLRLRRGADQLPLGGLLRGMVAELVHDDGVLVPLTFLRAVASATTADAATLLEVVGPERLDWMAIEHPSALVRSSAATFLRAAGADA